MSRLKILITVVFTLCSLFLIVTAGSFVSEAAVEPIEPIEIWDISENPGTDSVTAKLYINKDDNTKFDLLITGEGRMADFSSSDPAPWVAEYAETLITATVESYVTYIGAYTFFGCNALRYAYIYNPSIEFHISSDTVIPFSAAIVGHENSTAKRYATDLYIKHFIKICIFDNSICLVCGFECVYHSGGQASCELPAECEVCGAFYTSRKGHSYSDWTAEINPNCDTSGTRGHYTCVDCGKFFDREHKEIESLNLEAEGHNYGEWIEEVAPNCTSPGSLGHYNCSYCGKNFDKSKNEIDFILIGALGHTGGTATCSESAVCEKCYQPYGVKNEENHIYSAAFSFDDSSHWYGCLCGDKKDISTHNYSEKVIKQVSETEEGIKEFSCACGYKTTESISKLEQNENNSIAPKTDNLTFPVIPVIVIAFTITIVFAIVVIIAKKRR